MIQYHIYPGRTKRIVTFSYDDGHPRDARFIELLNKYGMKGTFHLNSGSPVTKEKAEEMVKLYHGHEVSCHTSTHGWPARMPAQSVVTETLENRRALEEIFGYPILGMSYPSGSFSEEVISAMRACGIVYARTVRSTGGYFIPEDFMQWHPTCHHNGALERCDDFIQNIDNQWYHPMFYIWGHAAEFYTEEKWQGIEEVLKKLAGHEKIWYATNIDIYNYMQAQKRLRISVNEKIFHNPSDITVFVEKDKRDIIEIPAGQTVIVD